MINSVILRRCATLSEAHICVGLLKANGIWASLDNAEHASLDWGAIPALGGVQIRVSASEYELAKRTIIEAVSAAPEVLSAAAGSYEPIRGSRRWRAASMLIIWFGILDLLAIPVLSWLDSVVPKTWLPDPDPNDFWLEVSSGASAAPPGPGAEGALLMTLIGLFLLWELLTTQPQTVEKDPQV